MLQRDSLVRGAAILAAGALLSRGLGIIYRFALPELMGGGEQGAYGMGLFGYGQQVYIIALTLSTMSLPLAVSKLVSERLARGDGDGALQVFRVSRALLAVLGLTLATGMVLVAPAFGRYYDANAVYSFYAVAPAVFVVPFMSSYRGLFQGLRVMTPYASSQVLEQVVRIATMLGLAALLLPWGLPYAAAGANFGAATGALASLLFLLYLVRRHGPGLPAAGAPRSARPPREWRKVVVELLRLALPFSLAGLAFPLFGLVDALVLPVRLHSLGFSQEEATKAYSALTQLAAPFINVPLSFTTAFALSLVPTVAEAAAGRDLRRVRRATGTALRVALVLTLPAVVGLMVLARHLTAAVFRYPEAGGPLQVLAVAALFIGLQQMSSASLQGLGLPMIPVRNLALAVGVKGALTWALPGTAGWEAEGAALATVIGFVLSSSLNLVSLARRTGALGLEAQRVARAAAAALVMGAVVFWARGYLADPATAEVMTLAQRATILGPVAVGALAYGALLPALGGITARDLELVPRVGDRLAAFLRRLHLLRA